jgi:hypothetical protein
MLCDLYLIIELDLLFPQPLNLALQVRNAQLGHVGFPVPEHEAPLIKRLVGRKGHLEVVPHSHQQNPPFRKIDCGLPDDLVEKLVVDLLSDGTNATFPGLLLYQLGLEGLFELFQFGPACLPPADVEPEEPAVGFEDVGLEHFIEKVSVFRVEVGCLDGVEDRRFLVDFLVLEELLLGYLYPVGVKDQEPLFDRRHCHNYYETNT